MITCVDSVMAMDARHAKVAVPALNVGTLTLTQHPYVSPATIDTTTQLQELVLLKQLALNAKEIV